MAAKTAEATHRDRLLGVGLIALPSMAERQNPAICARTLGQSSTEACRSSLKMERAVASESRQEAADPSRSQVSISFAEVAMYGMYLR